MCVFLETQQFALVTTDSGMHSTIQQCLMHARLQAWSDGNMARTRSARHKLLKFLRDNACLQTPSLPDPSSASTQGGVCGTMEIIGNMMRQPADLQGGPQAEPYAVKIKSHWLTVQCLDRAGTVADIARLIAQHDQNIKVGAARSSIALLVAPFSATCSERNWGPLSTHLLHQTLPSRVPYVHLHVPCREHRLENMSPLAYSRMAHSRLMGPALARVASMCPATI